MNLRKHVAVLTTVCFLISCVFNQAVYAMVAARRDTGQFKQMLDDFTIPSSLGRITRARFCDSRKVVINIQDLHCHPEVQRNISRLIGLLDRKYQLKNVYVEGASGNVSTEWLTSIADVNSRNAIIETLVDQGKLTGSEYYSVTQRHPDLIRGMEDEVPYDQNIVRLGKILEKKEYFAQKTAALGEDLAVMQLRYFNRQNRDFDRLVNEHRQGRISTGKYYRILEKYAGTINAHPEKYGHVFSIDEGKYANLRGYLELEDAEKRLHYRNIAHQLQQFVSVLKQKLPYSAYNCLLERSDNFTKLDELYVYLARSSREYHLDTAESFPDLNRFFAYIEKGQAVNPLQLVSEERKLVEQIRLGLSQDRHELEVSFLSDFFMYFADYLNNRLSADDYEYFTGQFDQFKTLWDKYAFSNRLNELQGDFALLDDFYRVNVARNDYFIKNILGDYRNSGTPASAQGLSDNIRRTVESLGKADEILVVVAGGFHTDGLEKLLDERHVSYLDITPNVTRNTKQSDAVYMEIAKQQAKILSQAIALKMLSTLKADEKNKVLVNALAAMAAVKLNGLSVTGNEQVRDRLAKELKRLEMKDATVSVIDDRLIVHYDGGKELSLDLQGNRISALTERIGAGRMPWKGTLGDAAPLAVQLLIDHLSNLADITVNAADPEVPYEFTKYIGKAKVVLEYYAASGISKGLIYALHQLAKENPYLKIDNVSVETLALWPAKKQHAAYEHAKRETRISELTLDNKVLAALFSVGFIRDLAIAMDIGRGTDVADPVLIKVTGDGGKYKYFNPAILPDGSLIARAVQKEVDSSKAHTSMLVRLEPAKGAAGKTFTFKKLLLENAEDPRIMQLEDGALGMTFVRPSNEGREWASYFVRIDGEGNIQSEPVRLGRPGVNSKNTYLYTTPGNRVIMIDRANTGLAEGAKPGVQMYAFDNLDQALKANTDQGYWNRHPVTETTALSVYPGEEWSHMGFNTIVQREEDDFAIGLVHFAQIKSDMEKAYHTGVVLLDKQTLEPLGIPVILHDANDPKFRSLTEQGDVAGVIYAIGAQIADGKLVIAAGVGDGSMAWFEHPIEEVIKAFWKGQLEIEARDRTKKTKPASGKWAGARPGHTFDVSALAKNIAVSKGGKIDVSQYVIAVAGTFEFVGKDGTVIHRITIDPTENGERVMLSRGPPQGMSTGTRLPSGVSIRAGSDAQYISIPADHPFLNDSPESRRALDTAVPAASPLTDIMEQIASYEKKIIDLLNDSDREFAFVDRPSTGGKKIGILPVSGNPWHNRHTLLTTGALQEAGLDEVVIALSPHHVIKKGASPRELAERIAMIRASFPENPRISIAVAKKSFSPVYVRGVAQAVPGAQMSVIMGMDNFETMLNHDPFDLDTVVKMHDSGILLKPRPGHDFSRLRSLLITIYKEAKINPEPVLNAIHVLDIRPKALSSTIIRDSVGRGESVWEASVHPDVAVIMKGLGLYDNGRLVSDGSDRKNDSAPAVDDTSQRSGSLAGLSGSRRGGTDRRLMLPRVAEWMDELAQKYPRVPGWGWEAVAATIEYFPLTLRPLLFLEAHYDDSYILRDMKKEPWDGDVDSLFFKEESPDNLQALHEKAAGLLENKLTAEGADRAALKLLARETTLMTRLQGAPREKDDRFLLAAAAREYQFRLQKGRAERTAGTAALWLATWVSFFGLGAPFVTTALTAFGVQLGGHLLYQRLFSDKKLMIGSTTGARNDVTTVPGRPASESAGRQTAERTLAADTDESAVSGKIFNAADAARQFVDRMQNVKVVRSADDDDAEVFLFEVIRKYEEKRGIELNDDQIVEMILNINTETQIGSAQALMYFSYNNAGARKDRTILVTERRARASVGRTPSALHERSKLLYDIGFGFYSEVLKEKGGVDKKSIGVLSGSKTIDDRLRSDLEEYLARDWVKLGLSNEELGKIADEILAQKILRTQYAIHYRTSRSYYDLVVRIKGGTSKRTGYLSEGDNSITETGRQLTLRPVQELQDVSPVNKLLPNAPLRLESSEKRVASLKRAHPSLVKWIPAFLWEVYVGYIELEPMLFDPEGFLDAHDAYEPIQQMLPSQLLSVTGDRTGWGEPVRWEKLTEDKQRLFGAYSKDFVNDFRELIAPEEIAAVGEAVDNALNNGWHIDASFENAGEAVTSGTRKTVVKLAGEIHWGWTELLEKYHVGQTVTPGGERNFEDLEAGDQKAALTILKFMIEDYRKVEAQRIDGIIEITSATVTVYFAAYLLMIIPFADKAEAAILSHLPAVMHSSVTMTAVSVSLWIVAALPAYYAGKLFGALAHAVYNPKNPNARLTLTDKAALKKEIENVLGLMEYFFMEDPDRRVQAMKEIAMAVQKEFASVPVVSGTLKAAVDERLERHLRVRGMFISGEKVADVKDFYDEGYLKLDPGAQDPSKRVLALKGEPKVKDKPNKFRIAVEFYYRVLSEKSTRDKEYYHAMPEGLAEAEKQLIEDLQEHLRKTRPQIGSDRDRARLAQQMIAEGVIGIKGNGQHYDLWIKSTIYSRAGSGKYSSESEDLVTSYAGTEPEAVPQTAAGEQKEGKRKAAKAQKQEESATRAVGMFDPLKELMTAVVSLVARPWNRYNGGAVNIIYVADAKKRNAAFEMAGSIHGRKDPVSGETYRSLVITLLNEGEQVPSEPAIRNNRLNIELPGGKGEAAISVWEDEDTGDAVKKWYVRLEGSGFDRNTIDPDDLASAAAEVVVREIDSDRDRVGLVIDHNLAPDKKISLWKGNAKVVSPAEMDAAGAAQADPALVAGNLRAIKRAETLARVRETVVDIGRIREDADGEEIADFLKVENGTILIDGRNFVNSNGAITEKKLKALAGIVRLAHHPAPGRDKGIKVYFRYPVNAATDVRDIVATLSNIGVDNVYLDFTAEVLHINDVVGKLGQIPASAAVTVHLHPTVDDRVDKAAISDGKNIKFVKEIRLSKDTMVDTVRQMAGGLQAYETAEVFFNVRDYTRKDEIMPEQLKALAAAPSANAIIFHLDELRSVIERERNNIAGYSLMDILREFHIDIAGDPAVYEENVAVRLDRRYLSQVAGKDLVRALQGEFSMDKVKALLAGIDPAAASAIHLKKLADGYAAAAGDRQAYLDAVKAYLRTLAARTLAKEGLDRREKPLGLADAGLETVLGQAELYNALHGSKPVELTDSADQEAAKALYARAEKMAQRLKADDDTLMLPEVMALIRDLRENIVEIEQDPVGAGRKTPLKDAALNGLLELLPLLDSRLPEDLIKKENGKPFDARTVTAILRAA